MLRLIREKGRFTCRDLLRTLAKGNTFLLERLPSGLVEGDGREVMAVTLEDVVRALHARPEFHEPDYLCPVLLGLVS